MQTFPGTDEEGADLLAALNRNCTCEFNEDGGRVRTCAPHEMLVNDQRAILGLLFMRRTKDCLWREECR